MCQCVQPFIFDNQKYLLFVCAYIGLCMKCIQVIGILYMNFCSWLWTFIKHLKCHWKNNQFAVMRKPFFFGFCFWITSPNSDFSVQSHLFLSPIGAWTLKMPVLYPPSNVGAYTRTPSPTMPMFSSVQSHVFLSQIGLGPGPLRCPSLTRLPVWESIPRPLLTNHSCSVVRAQIISLRSDDLVVPKLPTCGCEWW